MIEWPSEWAPHDATVIGWPWDEKIWGAAFGAAQRSLARAAAVIAEHETLYVLVDDRHRAEALRAIVATGARPLVVPLGIPTDDVWARDFCPTFVMEGGALNAVDWNFGAWGGKFPHANDALVAQSLADELECTRRSSSLVLEGGALETNGAGLVICTESVALNPNRNPQTTRSVAEAEIARLTGASQMLWLIGGMADDDTDGHVDTLARFVNERTVLMQRLRVADRIIERENRALLEHAGLDVIELPSPSVEGVPASYANFYWCNGAVLVPTFGVPEDDAACAIVRNVVDRPVVPIDSRGLITQGGAIHCVTQQIPAVDRRPPAR